MSSNSHSPGIRKSRILLIFGLVLALFLLWTFYSEWTHSLQSKDALFCHDSLKYLGFSLVRYNMTYGHLPPAGWDSSNGCPKWITALRDMAHSGGIDAHQLEGSLKCAHDHTNSPASYEVNASLLGKPMDSIEKEKWLETPLISEKHFSDSHRNILYLDRHIRSVKAQDVRCRVQDMLQRE